MWLAWRTFGASSFNAPCMQAFPPVSRCAAGALNRDTGQAGLGTRGDEPRFTPNSASWRVRFRFAAGEPKADGTWPLPINDEMPLSDCGFQHFPNRQYRKMGARPFAVLCNLDQLFSWRNVHPLATIAMSGKDSGFRIRVERPLREQFVQVCRSHDTCLWKNEFGQHIVRYPPDSLVTHIDKAP